MADFTGDDLTGSRFESAVDLSGSEFPGGQPERQPVPGGVELGNVDISGEIENVTVNGVETSGR